MRAVGVFLTTSDLTARSFVRIPSHDKVLHILRYLCRKPPPLRVWTRSCKTFILSFYVCVQRGLLGATSAKPPISFHQEHACHMCLPLFWWMIIMMLNMLTCVHPYSVHLYSSCMCDYCTSLLL
ncbi:unnamed protein product [Amoebophrya sp. A25]|nr:unnamed protein product [Amoebophrya sp. A25]|eukprot:GSA25T00001115001.1